MLKQCLTSLCYRNSTIGGVGWAGTAGNLIGSWWGCWWRIDLSLAGTCCGIDLSSVAGVAAVACNVTEGVD